MCSVFTGKHVTFKQAVNIFELVEIYENIYEGVVEPSYKKLIEQLLTVMVTSVQ